jgi:hypothetical protein
MSVLTWVRLWLGDLLLRVVPGGCAFELEDEDEENSPVPESPSHQEPQNQPPS